MHPWVPDLVVGLGADWPGLRARFRTVAPDMLGFGYSAKPTGYSYSLLNWPDRRSTLATAQEAAQGKKQTPTSRVPARVGGSRCRRCSRWSNRRSSPT